jgi:hypothetical protein
MATIEHKNISDAELHEPKGVASALEGTVYVADGDGSGAWGSPPVNHSGELGELYIVDGSTAFTLQAASAYSKLNPSGEWTAGASNVVTLSTTGEITLTGAGVYLVSFWVVFTTPSLAASTGYDFKYAINGTPNGRILTVKKYSNGADTLSTSATGFVTATAGDVLSVHVAGDGTSSETNITVRDAGLQVLLAHRS